MFITRREDKYQSFLLGVSQNLPYQSKSQLWGIIFSSSCCSLSSTVINAITVDLLAALSFGLLLDVVLDTTLASLSLGTELVVLGFLLLVTGKVGDSTSNGTLGTLADTRAEVTELTLGLLVSSLKVLLTAGLLQGLSHMLAKVKDPVAVY